MTLAKEVKEQQSICGDRDLARQMLMELAEKDLLKGGLLAKKEKHLPTITRNQEKIDQLSNLQEEEANYLARIEDLKRQIDAVDRPSTAM